MGGGTMRGTRMGRTVGRTALALGMAAAMAAPAGAQQGPDYDSPETRAIVEAMVEAHGGIEAWRAAPTVAFDNTFFNPFAAQQGQSPWWVAREVIDQDDRRVHQYWPLTDGRLAYDGERTWTHNWGVGNPPQFMVHFFYYFTQLPFLTQDEGVVLTYLGREELPGKDRTFDVVRMEFETMASPGKTRRDRYELFIDTEAKLLGGYRYWNAWGPMMDLMGVPEGEIFGPMLRVHDRLTTVDGFVVPMEMHTMAADGSQTYGYHTITNYSFTEAFDEGWMEMPEGAQSN